MELRLTNEKGEMVASYETKDIARIGRKDNKIFGRFKDGTLKLFQECADDDEAKRTYENLKFVLGLFSPNFQPATNPSSRL